MDCLSPSPFLSSDVDMDILTDTTPAPPSYDHSSWQWNLILKYAPVPPLDHNTFATPQPPSTRKTPIQEPPPFANQYNSAFAAPPPSYTPSLHAGSDMARNDLPGHGSVSMTPEPLMDFSNLNCLPTYHPYPINAMSDQTQDTLEIRSREPPRRAAISVATLLDEFERSLTLVADETPSSESDTRSNYNHQDELRIALHPPQTNVSDTPLAMWDHQNGSELGVSDADANAQNDSPPFPREAAESLGTLAYFLNFHDPSPRPFEQESMERLKGGRGQPRGDSPPRPPACFLDLAYQPGRPIEPASLPVDTLAQAPVTCPALRVVHPLARPRPPTPPPSRRRTKPGPSRTSRTNRYTTRLAATHQERIDPASKRAGGARVSRPLPVRYGRNRWEEEDQDTEQEGKEILFNRTKRTRFVVPDTEDDGEQDIAGRGTGKAMDGTKSVAPRRTTVTGPLRSILRNARATTMPYQKTGVKRRASVP